MSKYFRVKTLMLKGERGYSISNVQLNDDYTLTITLENGMHFNTSSIRGEKGEQGTGIRSVELRDDYSLLFTLDNGETLETTAILGKELENIRKLEASASSASKTATSASTSASASAQSASNASISASESSRNASTSASASEQSATNASQSATNASQSATNAQESASNASTSADTATSKATEASTSATKAKESEANAKLSETNASNSAKEAKESADSVANIVTDVSQLKSDIDKLNEGGLNLKDEVIEEDINNWLDYHPEATTTVQDESLTYKKLVKGTLGYVTPEMYGAKGDGTTDDTDAIQNAINSGKNIVFGKSKTYCISKTVFIESGSRIDFNFSTIVPISGGIFTQNKVFAINTNDCITWKHAYDTKITIISNMIARNTNHLNVCLFIVMGGIKAINIYTYSFYGSFAYSPNLYIDYRHYEEIVVVDNLSEQYALYLHGQGDQIFLQGIHSIVSVDNGNDKLISIYGSNSPVLEQIINGHTLVWNCQGASLNNFHIEHGSLTVKDSNTTIENFYAWKPTNEAPLIISQSDGEINRSSIINNASFKIRYSEYDYTIDTSDIDISNFNGTLILNNANRVCDVVGSDYKLSFASICILKTSSELIHPHKTNSVITNQKENGCLVDNYMSNDGYNNLLSVTESNKEKWNKQITNYYYHCSFLIDSKRLIGINHPASAIVKNIEKKGPYSNILYLHPQSIGLSARLYRGLSSSDLSEVVDIPVIQSTKLLDVGNEVQGFMWRNNTEERTSYNNYKSVEFAGQNVICRGGTKAPFIGTWKMCDMVYAATPTSTLKGWICIEDGTPGTWVAF